MKTSKPHPPSLPLRFFRWFCHRELRDAIEGDLMELYGERVEEMGKRKADWKFAMDVLLLFRPGIIKNMEVYQPKTNYGMYRNYLKVSFRVFNRERMYSLINVSGLGLGFTCCLLIFMFVRDELSYDDFHQDNDQIYRVASAYMRQGNWEPYSSNSWRTAELLQANFPEIKQMVRLRDDSEMFEYADKQIIERKIAYVEENFFDVFSFPLLEGNPVEVLKGPNKVVVSESTAAKYFGTESALGKVFEVADGAFQLEVSGVMKDMPSNSHFHFDFLISGETQRQISPPDLFTNVGWDSQYVYFKSDPGLDIAEMEARFPAFINANLGFFNSDNFKLFIQPLSTIHLESNNGLEIEPNGSMKNVVIFSLIAAFILFVACVNYMNLTTARSLNRAKEVGMRKVLGAKRTDLVNQFLTESAMMTVFGVLIALGLSTLALDPFNRFSGKTISYEMLFQPEVILTLLFAFVVIALFSGSYPSLILSAFKPLGSLKGGIKTGTSGLVFRKGLVVLQFVISIGMIAGTMVVYQQWKFLNNKDLGINEEMMLTIPLQTLDRRQLDAFKNELYANSSIKHVGTSNMKMPGWISNSTPYVAQDEVVDSEAGKTMKIIRVDMDFLPAVEAEILAGRNFSKDFPSDVTASIMLNESAAAQLEWEDPVGKWIELGDQKRYSVVGLVKDFHFESLLREIPPTIFILSPDWLNYAYIRIDSENINQSLAHIEGVYSKFVANREFSYSFMNEDMEQQYLAEEKFAQLISLFAALAIVIACLGTFGLISFSAQRRSKEIGIRKVLGASTGNVTVLLVREFVLLLLIASCIAWPIAWHLLDSWIEGFVYRTPIGIAPFVFSSLLAAFIVVATTGFRAIKAALTNPVVSLRDE